MEEHSEQGKEFSRSAGRMGDNGAKITPKTTSCMHMNCKKKLPSLLTGESSYPCHNYQIAVPYAKSLGKPGDMALQ